MDNNSNEKLVGIGATSKLSGLSERTLRYWESLGLINPVRLPLGHRKFSKTMIKKILAIKETLEKHNLRINDLITSSEFLQDDILKDKVEAHEVFDLNITLDSEIYAYAKKSGRLNPLTGLPGRQFIRQEINRRLDQPDGKPVMCYIDLKEFKYYNKRYGYDKGDVVLKFLAVLIYDILKENGAKEEIAGYLGEDNFVMLTTAERYNKICVELIKAFDLHINQYYEKEDREKGGIVVFSKNGEEIKKPLMTLSVSVVWNTKRKAGHYAQLEDKARDLKEIAQKSLKSELITDVRSD
ncbi:MAG: diguanylate cyclase [bacterium]